MSKCVDHRSPSVASARQEGSGPAASVARTAGDAGPEPGGPQTPPPIDGERPRHAAAAGDLLRLDSRRNKSPFGVPPGECMLITQFSGGRIDPEGGRCLQIRDLERVKALEGAMRCPAMLTLTIDRRRFEGPAEAYEYAMPHVSRLLSERLGATTWLRVIEVQTQSGDGWIHWHVLFDLSETAGYREVLRRVWALWRDKWGIGGCDLRRITKSAAGYLAAYISKKWPAVPPWMGESTKSFRIVGASKRAGEIIRDRLGIVPRKVRPTHRRVGRRRARTLYERLASSGGQCAVVYRDERGYAHYIASIPASFGEIVFANACRRLPWLTTTARNLGAEAEAGWRLTLGVPARCSETELGHRVESLLSALESRGILRAAAERVEARLALWKESWVAMQVFAGNPLESDAG